MNPYPQIEHEKFLRNVESSISEPYTNNDLIKIKGNSVVTPVKKLKLAITASTLDILHILVVFREFTRSFFVS